MKQSGVRNRISLVSLLFRITFISIKCLDHLTPALDACKDNANSFSCTGASKPLIMSVYRENGKTEFRSQKSESRIKRYMSFSYMGVNLPE
jgi:hypothetical protein